jgi:predicted dehydrogenase
MDPVRIGIIGCGVIAQYHLKGATASPLIRVEAVADVREGRPPKTSLENALVVQQITDAIYASSASGSAVEIS